MHFHSIASYKNGAAVYFKTTPSAFGFSQLSVNIEIVRQPQKFSCLTFIFVFLLYYSSPLISLQSSCFKGNVPSGKLFVHTLQRKKISELGGGSFVEINSSAIPVTHGLLANILCMTFRIVYSKGYAHQ